MEQKYKVEQIFTKNYVRLCAMATAILHDSSLAQDAVQEIYSLKSCQISA